MSHSMSVCRADMLGTVLAIVLVIAQFSPAADPTALTEHQRALHVLNRLGFGPRPADVDRVERMGVNAYVRQQLYPESIDDAAAGRALARFDTLDMDSAHLMDEFFGDIRRFIQQQMASGNAREMKMRYGIEGSSTEPSGSNSGGQQPNWNTPEQLAKRDAMRCIAQLQQAKLTRAVLCERQLQEVLVDFWSNHFNIDVRKDSCRALKVADDRDVIRPHVLGRFRNLLGASAHSPAMLAYLDNSENSATRTRSALEQRIVEMYVQSKFGIKSSGVVSDKEGLNENYGRELLELHTLGVDGGYTQRDVQEVARCFTGWGVSPFSATFNFDGNRHDKAAKLVLGHVIAAGGGIEDGERVLDILASHPATAHHIAHKLCQRFVSDDPPAELVDRAAKMFLLSDGDLRVVVRTIVMSPEFFAPEAYRAKIKSPFEYAVSAARATNATFAPNPGSALQQRVQETVEGAAALGYNAERLSAAPRKTLNVWVHDMGEPLFAFVAPTGYPEVSSKWVSPGALIDRLNFSLALTGQNVTDLRFDAKPLLEGADTDQPQAVLDRLAAELLHGEMTPATRATLLRQAIPQDPGGTVNVPRLLALILGSPEFQRR